MKGYKAIIEELGRTALNIPAGELSELISKPDEELTEDDSQKIADTLKGKYRDVVTSINKTADLNADKKLDEKFKAGQRTKAQEFEKLLKETFGIDSDKEGSELISDISEQLSKKAKGKDSKDLTDDDVKKHAAFVRMEGEYKKKIADLQKEHTDKLNSLQAESKRKDIFARVSQKALEQFEAMNPVLSDEPKRAAAQRQLLLEKLEGYDFEEVEDKFIISKDGKVAENSFGHKLEFEDLVKSTAEQYFDFKVATDRSSAAASGADDKSRDGDKNKNGHTYKGQMPKTQEEYSKMMNDDKLPLKDRMAINDHWEKNAPKPV